VVIFLSCKSTPTIPDIAFDEKAGFPLDRGAFVYVFADAKKARPIIDLIPLEELKDRQAKQMLDKTDFFAAAFFPPESARFLQLAAWGSYPKFGANIAFTFSKNWKKRRTEAGDAYWHSQTNGLSIMVTSNQAFITFSALEDASSSPLAVPPFAQIPEEFSQFKGSSPFACWLNNPADVITKVLKESGLPLNFPVQKLFITLSPAGLKNSQDQYEALIRMQFENALQARGVAAMFSLAGIVTPDESDSILAAVFFANPPVVSGNNIDIKSALLSGNGITLLLETFLLYLK
jgi:hypothetical protein